MSDNKTNENQKSAPRTGGDNRAPRSGGDNRGPRTGGRPQRPGGGGGDKRRMYMRRKVCRFCADKSLKIDYKEVDTLRRFTTEGGKIIPRRMSGNCAKHQRALSNAIKRARYIAFLPFVKK